MRVVKVLNNSLILALDDEGQEIILMGKGIGFQRSTGSSLCKKDIEKVFVLKDRDISKSIIRLAADTDAVFFDLAKSAIDYAAETHHMKLMDHLYLSLTDHLSFAVKRMKDGIVFHNFYTMEMKSFNPAEFDVGNYTLRLVKERLDVQLPDDEAGNIAFHFINAQQNNPYRGNEQLILEVEKDILAIIKYSYKIDYNRESTSYSRLVRHLRLFIQRLISGEQLPEEKSGLLYEQIKKTCARELICVKKIGIYIYGRFHEKMTKQEELYLAVHIHCVMEELLSFEETEV